MPRTRLFTARRIVRFEPSRETFEAELPGIYGYAPHILDKLMADVKLEEPKIVLAYQEYFVATRKEITLNVINSINYKLVQVGDTIEINSPNFAKHGSKIVVLSKSKLCVRGYLVDEPDQRVKISASSIKFLPPPITSNKLDLRAKFKVGDLCLITQPLFRPRYEENEIFRIVSAGFKYVRVEPIKPKFKLWHRKPEEKERKKNQFVHELGVDPKSSREFYYSTSVYNMDIPYHELATVQEIFGAETGEMICDFTELGL